MKNFDKNLIWILGFAVVLAICWVGFSLYFSRESDNISPNAESYTEPIEPSFDVETIEKVNKEIENLPVAPEVIREVEELIKDVEVEETIVDENV